MEKLDRRSRRFRPSPAMAVAMLALLVSLGGSAAAAHVLITSQDIKDGTIRLVDISPGAKNSLHAHATNADIADEAFALNDASSFKLIGAATTPTAGKRRRLGSQGRF